MHTYISILRGINVSGQKLIKMAELRKQLSELGLQEVTTYIQSGNIIFQSSIRDSKEISHIIHKKIKEDYGFEVPVITLSREALLSAATNNPYKSDNPIEQLHITFLEDIPTSSNVDALDHTKFLPDEFEILDKAVYLNVKNGYGKSKLTNNLFESKLKVMATTRNMKTVNKLLELSA